jgi:hypothetical protein
MNQRPDLTSAVLRRERSRNRIRLVTVTVGVGALATAGVVAYQLPGPAHTTAGSGTTTPAARSSASSQRSGDDGHSDDGQASGETVAAPSGISGRSSAQATSGGS